jgi:hypothetical protein
MSEMIQAEDYLLIGAINHYLCNMYSTVQAQQYRENCEKLCSSLNKCGFHNALAAAKRYDTLSFPMDTAGRIMPTAAVQLKEIAATVSQVLYHEAEDRKTVTLKTGDVSEQLRNLPSIIPSGIQLTNAQMELLNEAIRCIECGAHRAASVMGWNVVFDYMRTWMLNNGKTKELNNGLMKICPKKKQIVQYEDFFDKEAPNERNILDAMAHQDSGPILGGEIYDHLIQYLRYRNKYAHASEKPVSAAKTNAYIEQLIDIILAPPFA